MGEKLKVLVGGQLVVERNDDAAAIKDRVRGNQPLRLIGHNNRGAITGTESTRLQELYERERRFFEIAVSQPAILSVAIGFDEARFVGPTLETGGQRLAERIIFCQIEHQSLAWMRS